MEGEKTGISTVVAELHSPADPVPGTSSAEQLPLLPLHNAQDVEFDAEKKTFEVRGAGRPRGALNKNTKEWRDYILSRYQSPLVALAETYSRPVDVLMKELNCSRLDAFKLQIAAAKELAPYIHQKQPIAVEAGEGGLINLVINTGGQGDGRDKQAGESDENPDYLEVEFLDIKNE